MNLVNQKLSKAELDIKLKSLDGWQQDEHLKCLIKEFSFKSYLKNIAFVNAVAWIANKENHHPDLEVSFGKCVVRLTTHDAGGVTESDFKMAELISHL